ncbi:PD-(D/E)XK nuclease family protein [Streptomyces sp. NPDC001407]|uniref:PD-(D/E)XK nuclease family protein n=1 Tax=Streptomyces sp. NPDC001407 TaxID=3364573 RepID=UPI00368F6851
MKPTSVSQHTTLAQCSEAHRLARVEKVPQREAAWFHHGTAVHSAIEEYERSGRSMDVEAAVGVFERSYDALVEEAQARQPDYGMWMAGGRTKPQTDIRNRRKAGADQVRSYLDWAEDDDSSIWTTPDGQKALELPFDIDLYGVRVKGFIDQVVEDPYLGLVVRDIKTGTTKAVIQLATYRVALEMTYGVKVNWGDWWLGKTGTTTKPVDLRPFTARWLATQYEATTAIRDNDLWSANPGSHCFACTVKDSCFLYSMEP